MSDICVVEVRADAAAWTVDVTMTPPWVVDVAGADAVPVVDVTIPPSWVVDVVSGVGVSGVGVPGPPGATGPAGPPGASANMSGMVGGEVPIAATPNSVASSRATFGAGNVVLQAFTAVGASQAANVDARAGRWLNVVDDFGADPTGTGDCTAAFNAGMAMSTSLYIPKGHYRLDANLAPIIRNGFLMHGAGVGVSLLEFHSTTGDLISVGDGTATPANVTIQGITIVAKTVRTSGYAIRMRNGHRIAARDIHILSDTSAGALHFGGVAFDGGSAAYMYFLDNFVMDNGSDAGILWQADAVETWVTNGEIAAWKNGMRFVSCSGYTIQGVGIIGSSDVGMLFSPPTGMAVKYGFVSAVVSDTNNGDNWRFESAGTGYTAYLTADKCWGSSSGTTAGAGFNLNDPRSRMLSFSQCMALNNKQQGVVINAGSEISFGDGSIVASNSAAGSGLFDGVYVAAGVSKVSLEGLVSGNAPGEPGGGLQRYGIYIAAGAGDYLNVDNCQLQGNTTGEWFLGATGAHNKFSASGTVCLGGNVGIGTNTPIYRLHIKSASVSSYPFVVVGASSAVTGVYAFEDGSGNFRFLLNDSTNANTVILNSNGASVFTGGNVGIGTGGPNDKLDVRGNAKIGAANDAGTIAFGDTANPAASGCGVFIGRALDAASSLSLGGYGGIYFHTVDATGALSAAKMVVDTSGNVGVNTTAPQGRVHSHSAATAGSTVPFVAGMGPPDGSDTTSKLMQFVDAGYTFSMGSITRNALGVLYNTTSDERLKEDIRPTEHGIEALMKIKVEDFGFKGTPGPAQQGMRAQALEKIYPQAVHVGGDDPDLEPWGIDYGRLTPLSIRAIQQQQVEIEALKRRLEAFEARAGNPPS